MKSYTLDTQFTFGKYTGKSVEEVLRIQPSYLSWCAINLDHFFLSDAIIAQIMELFPSFRLSAEAKRALSEKEEPNNKDRRSSQYDYGAHGSYGHDNYDYEADTFDALTDGQYGSYDDFLEGGGDMDHLRDALGF